MNNESIHNKKYARKIGENILFLKNDQKAREGTKEEILLT
jgi:ABC-type polar amino acid transport system ATPase subunit